MSNAHVTKVDSGIVDFGINEYARRAKKTAVYRFIDYPLLALGEEVGEVFGKIAKHSRKNGVTIAESAACIARPFGDKEEELRSAVEKELGDVIWQWANLCLDLGFNPSDVMQNNLDKLAGRAERGTINGEGDNR